MIRKENFNLSWITDIPNNFDGPQKHYTEWTKLISQGHIPHHILKITIMEMENKVVPGVRDGRGRGHTEGQQEGDGALLDLNFDGYINRHIW